MPPRSRPTWALALAAVATGVVVALLLVELAVRVATGSLLAPGGADNERYSVQDPVEGRIPRPGLAFRHPTKGFNISIGERGTRRNGNPPPAAARPLTLVVGDSFAFGDEVDDDATFPAVLERLTGQPVINAGVPGYGLDQAVLRAERLAAVYHPDTIIVSFIPHDVLRCQMSYWSGHPKPFFEIAGGALSPRPAPEPPPDPLAPLKRLLAYSMTMELLLPTWLHWQGPYEEAAHTHGREVACALMARLAAFATARGISVVVLAQPQQPSETAEHLELKDGVLACARAAGLPALDLFPAIAALPSDRREALFHGHMTPAGNQLVAESLARLLAADAPPHAAASGGNQ